MKTQYSHVSFDLDGTIIDSLDVMKKAWLDTQDEFGISNGFVDYFKGIGLPFNKILASMSISDSDKLIENYYFSRTIEYADDVIVYDGFHGFIKRLSCERISTSIITSKNRNSAELLLDKFDINVDVLICGDDNPIGKPDGGLFDVIRSQCASMNGFDSIYFGDMVSDALFSINAGVDYCHCNFGTTGPLSHLLFPRFSSINSWMDAYDVVFYDQNVVK